jgi:hypothetical protein
MIKKTFFFFRILGRGEEGGKRKERKERRDEGPKVMM